ncbi:MAG TPA: hypothetical protein PLB10_09045 [Thiolinea sp.]|nr:hypothetical protein [Thiolinea sp.]
MKITRTRLVLGGLLGAVLALAVLPGVAESPRPLADRLIDRADFVRCTAPRPEICYEIFLPVCAARNGRGNLLEQVSYPNDCKACADPAVIGFTGGGSCENSPRVRRQ